jgi:hypothetical protein
VIYHANGSAYEGEFSRGEKVEGRGVFKYANGNVGKRTNYSLSTETGNVHYKQLEAVPTQQQTRFIEYMQRQQVNVVPNNGTLSMQNNLN